MLKLWSESELRQASSLAVEHFIKSRLSEPTKKYEQLLSDSIIKVEKLFIASQDLRSLNGSVFVKNPDLIDAGRFLTGPPISQDDLKTLAGVKPPKTAIDDLQAEKVADIIMQAIDRKRFPWIAAKRAVKRSERRTAILWTAGVWAVELIRTWRRSESSRTQEALIADILRESGYKRVDIPAPRNIRPGDFDLFPRGTYTGELKLDGSKCDVPVRLRNGKILAIECKVSNSEVNSIKRLVREVGGKADAWRNSFGAGIITVSVLSGVFGLTTLIEAQKSHGVNIVWEHDLSPLKDFLVAN